MVARDHDRGNGVCLQDLVGPTDRTRIENRREPVRELCRNGSAQGPVVVLTDHDDQSRSSFDGSLDRIPQGPDASPDPLACERVGNGVQHDLVLVAREPSAERWLIGRDTGQHRSPIVMPRRRMLVMVRPQIEKPSAGHEDVSLLIG